MEPPIRHENTSTLTLCQLRFPVHDGRLGKPLRCGYVEKDILSLRTSKVSKIHNTTI
jgi:hypothetical protein